MLEEIIEERKQKLEKYRKKFNPFPSKSRRDFEIKKALDDFDKLAKSTRSIFLAGRVRGQRKQGGVSFLDLEDASGKIQILLKKDLLSNFELLEETLDIGDFLEAEGRLFLTKSGEKTLEAKEAAIIAKALRPLPSSFYGLEDQETRLRKRYLDILLHPELRELFEKKTVFWNSIRSFLAGKNFLEVETPVLEQIPGGAEAEPFVTHHNALDEDFFLRISLELPLKKLIVAGFEKIFEIGRVFRNEGMDREHLQDYTQMEFYWAYQDYNSLMDFIQKMYQKAIKDVFGSLATKWQGREIDWGKKWPKIEYLELLEKKIGFNPQSADEAKLRKFLKENFDDLPGELEKLGKGRLIDLVYKKAVRPDFVQPAFLVHHPVEIDTLAKRKEDDDSRVERFQIVACGSELGNGYSELNDPIDQRKRFEAQMKLRATGDKEAQMMDEDFLEALEYGMPPTAGFGMSERLFSVLADRPIRETVIFPLMRKGKES